MPQRQNVRGGRMSETEAFLTNCRIADGRLVDIGVAGGKIVTIGEGAAASSNSAPALDVGGDLVLPGLVDGQCISIKH
jgi:dihydroorotase-like cyclic amidohydrolase